MGSISHDFQVEETIEAKARWFQSLSLEERMDVFCQITNLVLENNPEIVNHRDARRTSKRVRVLSLIASKRAAGREVDLEDVRILELASSDTSAEE